MILFKDWFRKGEKVPGTDLDWFWWRWKESSSNYTNWCEWRRI